MDYLPIGFPKALIKDSTDFARIHTYCRKYLSEYYDHYHFGHFLMAAYASVPALLTPDLLYRIWMNFNTYQWGNETLAIHRVAVADLLLSGLCKNIGFELYEMPDSIRFPLRKWLEDTQEPGTWQDRGFAKAQDVAAFVEAYHKRDNPGRRRWGKNYHDRQLIEAIAARNPAEAQHLLLEWAEKHRKQDKKLDQYRMLDLITRQRDLYQLLHQTKKSDPSSPYYVSPVFEQNALLADLQKAKLQDEDHAIAQLIQEHFDLLRDQVTEKKPPQGESIEVRIPKELGKSIKRKPAFQAVLIGVDQYENNYLKPLKGCKNDVTAFATYFQQAQSSFLSGYTCTISVLTDASATKELIESTVTELAQLNHGDAVFVYFSGHSQQHEQGTILNLYRQDEGIILGRLVDQLLAIIKEKRLHILFAIDSHLYRNEISTDEHRDLFTQGDLVLLYGSAIKNIALEQEFEGKKMGYFSAKFLEIIREHFQLTYDQCFAKLREAMGEKQVPFIEAVPPLALYNQFLIGSPGKNIYQLDYDEQQDKWRLQAGLRDGITPSAGFIPTIVRNNKGVEWKISAIQEAAAEAQLMSTPESPIEKTQEVVVVQNAPFKIRVGLSEGFQAALELNRRQNNADLLALLHDNPYTQPLAELLSSSNYFYLVNQQEDAELKIAQIGNPPKGFYLTKNNSQTWESADQPLLPIVPELVRLNKQLHWISSFLFVKRLEGKDAGLKHRFKIKLYSNYFPNNALAQEVKNEVTNLELILNSGNQASFSCRIDYTTNTTYPVFVYALLLHEDEYRIQLIDQHLIQDKRTHRDIGEMDDSEVIDIRYLDSKETKIPLRINTNASPVIDGVVNKQLMLVFSQHPVDVKIFEQASFFEPNTWINALQEQNFRVGAFDVRRVEMRLVAKGEKPDPKVIKPKHARKTQKKVLFLYANPGKEWDSRYTLKEEFIEIKQIIDRIEDDFIRIQSNDDLFMNTEKLVTYIRKNKETLQIIHFSGHSRHVYSPLGRNPKSKKSDSVIYFSGHGNTTGLLSFENNLLDAGNTKLQSIAPNLKLWFLNACATGRQIKYLLEGGIPAVIGIPDNMSDSKTIAFSKSFYEEFIEKKRTLSESFNIAIEVLGRERGDAYIYKNTSDPNLENKLGSEVLGLYINDKYKIEDILDWRLEEGKQFTRIDRVRNPYIVGPPIKDTNHFFGRDQLLFDLQNILDRRVCIIGARRMGKTSLLYQAAQRFNKENQQIPLLINLQGLNNEVEMGQYFFRVIERSSKEHSIVHEFLNKNQPGSFIDLLAKWAVYCSVHGLESVLLVDEADQIQHLEPHKLTRLIQILEAIDLSISVVITGSRSLKNLKAESGSFLNYFEQIKLGVLSTEESIHLLTQDGKVGVSKYTLDEIMTICGNHPYLMQYIASKLYKEGTLIELDKSPNAMIPGEDLMAIFADEYRRLSKQEQSIMNVLEFTNLISVNELSKKASIPKTQIKAILLELEELGFIRNEKSGIALRNLFWKIYLKSALS